MLKLRLSMPKADVALRMPVRPCLYAAAFCGVMPEGLTGDCGDLMVNVDSTDGICWVLPICPICFGFCTLACGKPLLLIDGAVVISIGFISLMVLRLQK